MKNAKIADLIPDEKNANRGTPRGEAMLERSLREYGAGRSILLDRNNRIIAGNKTAEQAYAIGLDDVVIVETDGRKVVAVKRTDIDLDTPQGRELALADNRVGQVSLDWDPQVLADLGDIADVTKFWDEREIDELLADINASSSPPEDPGAQVDRAEELREKWQTERGQLWQVGRHRLLCGDSTSAEDVARLMGNHKAEMVWTDPPYGVAVGDKNKYLNSIAPSNRVEENLENDAVDEPTLCAMLSRAFDNALEHCLAGGAWYVAAPAGPLHVMFGQLLKERGVWRQTIQWVKNNATFSPMGVDYHWRAEPIFYGWKPGAGHRYYGGRQQTTVWEIDRPLKSPEHPTMKPVELVARAVENSSKKDEVVLDTFCGSGTTLVACEQSGRVGCGVEYAPKYVAVILERLSQMGLEPKLL